MIKISKKVQYGIRALLELSLYSKDGPVLLKDIAQRESIPIKFLEQIFISLKTAGLVRSRRGALRGYQLTKPAEEIRLSEIILALEGDWSLVECKESTNCCATLNAIVTYEVWEKASNALSSIFDMTSLRDLIERYKILEQEKEELSRLKKKWHSWFYYE